MLGHLIQVYLNRAGVVSAVEDSLTFSCSNVSLEIGCVEAELLVVDHGVGLEALKVGDVSLLLCLYVSLSLSSILYLSIRHPNQLIRR